MRSERACTERVWPSSKNTQMCEERQPSSRSEQDEGVEKEGQTMSWYGPVIARRSRAHEDSKTDTKDALTKVRVAIDTPVPVA
jgi:hypothetical protein